MSSGGKPPVLPGGKSQIPPPPPSSSSSLHQRLSMLTSSASSSSSHTNTTTTTSSSSSKPFMRSKSQTTSSIVFPSFRFSPESEEIQEITTTDQRGGHTAASSSSTENGTTAAASSSSSSKEQDTGPEGSTTSSSSSSSSKQGGDISPLKEYILKHKWTNKWEKRSLSLDLDLKGKIITAIEDKRRSFVSHFLNEEDEEVIVAAPGDPSSSSIIIDRSCSIPEQLVAGGTTTTNNTAAATTSTSASCLVLGSDPDYYDHSSIHSDSVVLTATTMMPSSTRRRGHNSSSNRSTTRLNMFEDTNFDYGDDDINDYFNNSNGSPVHSVSPAGGASAAASELRDLVVEEVGVDCIEELLLGSCPSSPDPLSHLRQFVLPPEQLQERFQGLPTLYNPPSVVKNLRKYPSQEVAAAAGGVITTETPAAATSETTTDPQATDQQQLLPTTTTSDSSDNNAHPDSSSSSVLTFPGMVFSIFRDVCTHPWVKYWFVGLSVLFVIGLGPFLTGLVSFALGVTAVLIVNGALYPDEALVPALRSTNGDEVVMQQQQSSSSSSSPRRIIRSLTPQLHQGTYFSSQGWMCTLDTTQQYPAYNAFEFHLRNTKAVFIRLDGPTLVISTPHSRHRVSRRRLWSDPPITTDIVFVRHQQFNLTDAKVEIVPKGLTRKRVWCKKYPIAVTLATKDKFCGKLLSITSGFVNSTQDESQSAGSGGTANTAAATTCSSVSYSKGDGVKVKDVPPQPDASAETYKGEVYRDEGSCAGKTIYLFARTDREKDDWFRRLIKASRTPVQTTAPSSTSPQPGSIFSTTTSLDPDSLPPVSYMQKSCPTITIPRCLVTMPTTTTSSSSSPSTPSRRSTPTNELNSSGGGSSSSSSGSGGGGPPVGSQKTTPEKEQRLLRSGGTTTSTTNTTDISPGLFPAESLLMMSNSCTPTFLNALISRLGYDFLHSDRWKSEVIGLIDRKLLFLRKPSFVQSLRVRELDMGDSLPVLTNASTPVLDDQGLWVDFDVRFEGSLVITIEAFVNFLNLKTKEDSVQLDMRSGPDNTHDSVRVNVSSSQPGSPSKHAMFDSDADDSGESSESEDDQFEGDEDPSSSSSQSNGASSGGGSSSSHPNNGHAHHHQSTNSSRQDQPPPPQDSKAKLFKYADTIVKSSVMRNKHVQKVVGAVAATPIILIVEVNRVIGSVALNIPPVPNNRVWIGFRSNPIIDINAKPKVGERFIGFTQVTGWIRKKLLLEFQRIMVCPNMMDVSLSFLQYDLPK